MSFKGVYTCETKTPIGTQSSTLTFLPSDDGLTFSGKSVSSTGELDFFDGRASGNHVTWRMDLVRPLKLTLYCEGQFENGHLTAVIHAGAIGKMQLSGHRIEIDTSGST